MRQWLGAAGQKLTKGNHGKPVERRMKKSRQNVALVVEYRTRLFFLSSRDYHLLFTYFIYILANYYLLLLDTLNPLFTANR
jgi:hypothetical protein